MSLKVNIIFKGLVANGIYSTIVWDEGAKKEARRYRIGFYNCVPTEEEIANNVALKDIEHKEFLKFQEIIFTPDINSIDNHYKQAYDYFKTQPEFLNAEDC